MKEPRIVAGFFNKMHSPTGGDPQHVKKSRVPDGQSYISHQGHQQRLRRLRQMCRGTLRSKDPDLVTAIERIRLMTSTEANPEYGMLYLINRAQELSASTYVELPTAINVMLDQLLELVTTSITVPISEQTQQEP